jgi:hypothetical protein
VKQTTHPANTKTKFSHTASPNQMQNYFVCVVCGDSLFENRVLWWLFVPERGEVTGSWAKIRNEELRYLFLTRVHCSGWFKEG